MNVNINISKSDYEMDTEAVTMQAFGNLLMEIHDTTQNRGEGLFHKLIHEYRTTFKFLIKFFKIQLLIFIDHFFF